MANSVWRQEARKWEHLKGLKVSVATGTDKERRAALNAKADIYVINRENVVWLLRACKGRWPYDAIVIDESSSFKSSSTKRFRGLKKVTPLSSTVVLLTGTPSPNGLLDLWSQCFLMDGGSSLGKTITGYKQRFFTPDYFGYTWTPKPDTEQKIYSLLEGKVLSMQGADYLELPERIDLVEEAVLPWAVMEKYREFERELFMEFEDVEIEAMSAAVLANKMLQFANGALYVDDEHNWTELHKAKLDVLDEIIDENPQENILVAYNYRHDLARLMSRFPKAVVLDKDPKTIARWNRGEIPLLLAHPASCGHGINLQGGGAMIVWFGLNWNLEYYKQMNARLHRQGQDRPVRVVRIVASGTIDERVLSVLGQKDAVQNDLLLALRRRQ